MVGAKAGREDLAGRVAGRLAAGGVAAGDGIVAAVSGGGDSVALLCLLTVLRGPLSLQVSAAHLHHGLRGPDADSDLGFVADLCRRLGVALIEGRVDVAGEARAAGISLEMAARVARHRFLEAARRQAGARFVALGHHADDQAETVLLRLGRGSGLLGAGAMRAEGPGAILRPLLGERRAALRAYLDDLGQAWRDDATNVEAAAARNRLRLAVLPAWEAADPGVSARLARSATLLREDGELLASAVASLLPAPVRDNGGPWRLIPWSLWSAAPVPLRRQLLRQAAWSVAGVFPPARWSEAWARWPEAHETRPDLVWLRVARTAGAAVVHRPPGAAAIALPDCPGLWRLTLPDGACLAAEAADTAGPAVDLGAAPVVRRVRVAERLGDSEKAPPARDLLRRRGVPAPCRGGAWLVAGAGAAWLPVGPSARQAVLAGGSRFDLVWQAAPVCQDVPGWPRPGP